MAVDRADIYVTDNGKRWSLMPQTERVAAHIGSRVRQSVELTALEAWVICDEARKKGLRIHGEPQALGA